MSPAEASKSSPYKIKVSATVFHVSLVVSFALAFGLGHLSKASSSSLESPPVAVVDDSVLTNLPIPSMTGGMKPIDMKVYGSDAAAWVQATEASCAEKDDDEEEDEDEDDYGSLGQHLMLDFQYLDSKALEDAEKLASTMIDTLNKSELSVTSYHCHRPSGIACQWALANGRASYTTWPEHGLMSLDVFLVKNGEDEPLLSISLLPNFEEAFSFADPKSQKKPKVNWLLKSRGFEAGEASEGDILASSDMDIYPLGAAARYKKHVASVKSIFQTINVYDVLTDDRTLEDYEKSLSGDDSYQAQNPELFEPDRIVFMGGLLQSRRLGDAAYHEALVHPGLFAHPNPKRVGIIGGGEGATLREILKHDTIEQVIMIDIDKMIVEISKEYLPGWNNCTNLVGRAESCFEDEKAAVYLEDAFKWFKDRFLEGAELEGTEEKFDVIIMDALDPQGLTEFVANLYTDPYFYESLYRGLNDNGMLIAQLGAARGLNDPPEDHSVDRFRLKYIEGLAKAGFKATREYAEGGCGFGNPWLFTASFKQREDEFNWFANDAEIDYKIRTRLTPTIDGNTPLNYFDSSSMKKYKYPPKSSALVHCRREPLPKGCETIEDSRASDKVSILPAYYESLESFVDKGVLPGWYKDLFASYSGDHLRPDGDEFAYNPDGDRRVHFD